MIQRIAVTLLVVLIATVCAQQPKTAIAVLTLKEASGVSTGEAELLTDRLRIELFNTGGFSVMERDQMNVIMREQGFQHSGACTDEGCMIEIGQLLGVTQLVTGSVGRLGSLYMINVRSIDVRTGSFVKVVSEDIRGRIEDVVGVLPAIAAVLAGRKAPAPRKSSVSPAAEGSDAQDYLPKGKFDCDKPVFFQAVLFNGSTMPLEFTDEDPDEAYAEINEEVNEMLLDAFNELFEDRVGLTSEKQRANADGCASVFIVTEVHDYATEPDARDQFTGTVDVSFSFYEGATATSPAYKVRIRKQGDRHWGAVTPFENAFEEVAEAVEDDIDREDYIRSLRRKVR